MNSSLLEVLDNKQIFKELLLTYLKDCMSTIRYAHFDRNKYEERTEDLVSLITKN